MDPNTCRKHQGEHLQDYGFEVFAGEQRYHGNCPTVYARGSDGRLWEFDGCFHLWSEARA